MRRTLNWVLLPGAFVLLAAAALHYRYYLGGVVCQVYQRERIKP